MKQVIKLDASALIKGACNLRLKRTVVDGYTDALPYNDTQYGSAFHEFVKVMYTSKGNFAEAIIAANNLLTKPCQTRDGKAHLNIQHLDKTCVDYWQHFQATDEYEVFVLNDKPLVEIYFENRFMETDDYIVYLVGTIDSFGKIKNGIYAIRDFKTHSLWSVSKKGTYFQEQEMIKFLNQFELSLQLRFYLYNLKLLAKDYPDTEFASIIKRPMGMFIDGVFLSGSQKTEFRRSEIWIPTEQDMQEFDALLTFRVNAFLYYLKYQALYNYRDGMMQGACIDHKFPCAYNKVCAARDDFSKNSILSKSFITKPYEPKEFGR